MSRSSNIALHLKVAAIEIRQGKKNLARRLWNHACGIARALSPSYSANF